MFDPPTPDMRCTAAATLTGPMAPPEDQRDERARAWYDAAMRAVCDSIVEWEHGAVLRAAHYPTYWKYNHVRVDGDPRMTCDELIAFADEALSDYAHRHIEFTSVEPADRLRGDFERHGWRAMRVVWMRHEQPPLLSASHAVTVVPYDALHELRVAWFQEDFPGHEPGEFLNYARETAERRAARIIAVVEGDAPVGYAQVEYAGGARVPRRRPRHRRHARRDRIGGGGRRPVDPGRRRGPAEGALRAAWLPPGLDDDGVPARTGAASRLTRRSA
jgi:hypothetical protein